jgi:hypothetical protein
VLAIKTLNECEKANMKFRAMKVEKAEEMSKVNAII